MESSESRHNRFIGTSTCGISVLEVIDKAFELDPSISLHKAVQYYHERMQNDSVNNKILDVLYRVLCNEYQVRVTSGPRSLPEDFENSIFLKIIDKLVDKCQIHGDNSSILLDILVLELALYCNCETIKTFFQSALRYDNEEMRFMSYKLAGSLIDALYMNSYIHKGVRSNQASFPEILLLTKKLINHTPNTTHGTEWALLSSILTKLITTFECNDIISCMWTTIMTKDNEESQLMLFTLAIDKTWLVTEKINLPCCSDIGFWHMICNSLSSTVETQRKQALYIMKNVLDFIEKWKIIRTIEAVPFIHCQRGDQCNSIHQIKINFFLLLECLEEKQAHLVTPALTHLESLIKGNIDHLNCGNCFNRMYLHCIFKRILQHKTKAVILVGLMEMLKIDPNIYDEEFIIMLEESLNNTFLYMNHSNEVIEKLAMLFIKAENSQVNLMKTFISIAARITWTPVSLFYVIKSFGLTTETLIKIEYNAWTENELEAVTKIIQNNLKLQSPPLQQVIQFYICEIFSHYVKQSIHLDSVASLLSAFDTDETRIFEKKSWKTIVKYVETYITEENATRYLHCLCEKLMINETGDEVNVKSFSSMIILLNDAKKIFITKSCFVKKSLYSLFNFIIGSDLRLYADTSISNRVIELITCLLDYSLRRQLEENISKDGSNIQNLIISYLDSIQRFIFKSLSHSSSPKHYDEAKKYVKCFRIIISYNSNMIPKNYYFFNQMKLFYDESIRILNELDGLVNIKYWYILHILYLSSQCYNTLDVNRKSFHQKFLIKICERALSRAEKDDCHNGQMISESYERIAELIYNFLITNLCNDPRQWLLRLKNLLEQGKEYVVRPIISILIVWSEKAAGNIIDNATIIESIVDLSWKLVWDLKKDKLYWCTIEPLISLMINFRIHKIEGLNHIAVKHIDYLIANTDNIPTVRSLLLTNISQTPSTDDFYFYDILLSCLLHTTVGRTDRKIEMQTYNNLIKSHGINFFLNLIIPKNVTNSVHIDIIFRAHGTLLLLNKLSTETKVCTTHNMMTNLLSILKSYENKRYFGDSNLHKLKHRIMQLLLLLQPMLNLSSTKELHDTICHLIISESNQPTVRVMQEWLLVKIYIDHPLMQNYIWHQLEMGKEKRPSSVTSLASIIYHVSCVLTAEKKKLYIEQAVENILPCCFSQQFVVRLYCQVILSKLFDMLRYVGTFLPEHTIIESAVRESLRYGNLKKNSIKLFNDFYFTLFDPVKDFNLQTIFYDLPRLLNMSMDEWIPIQVFQNINDYFHFHSSHLSLDIIDKFDSINPLLHSSKSWDDDLKSVTEATDDIAIGSSDIQKKIMPWTWPVPISDKSSEIFHLMREKKLHNDIGIIVVASLIDSMPNLGGLCRTSEIFCAKQLILGSVKYTENKEFQTLSVSSEKWITIIEVKPHELENYLMKMKSMGWELVGAEQTVNSVGLQNMKFNKKTILLLGNEKSGIPANLIPLMDMCVEIPQAGVVRSLNVHVTGAICMWHYAQQHIFQS